MKDGLLIDREEENKKELTLEKARELLSTNKNNEPLTDEKIMKIIDSIKVFCKVAYEMYSEEQDQKTIKQERNSNETHSEKFKDAA